ncbi:MAG: lipoyl(octanoyl) transferase LipB [Candidatus Zixiibacteriota bacterium]|nr:MAG: lipoyl(octanoyl) transferase LipB [candidate division Zixibacteria bacterium]
MTAFTERAYLGWVLDLGRVEFERVLGWQHGLVKLRKEGMARDTIIFVEHPPVITVGKDGHPENFRDLGCRPVFIERGGDVTYHGPGQLVVYFIFNLSRRGRDIHRFMGNIQEGIIAALKEIGIDAKMGDEHTGVWVGDRKIASIGVAVTGWISFHGAAVNLNTDLRDFEQISPCGLDPKTMTSAAALLAGEVELGGFADSLLARYTDIFDTEFSRIELEEIAEDIESQAGGNVI